MLSAGLLTVTHPRLLRSKNQDHGQSEIPTIISSNPTSKRVLVEKLASKVANSLFTCLLHQSRGASVKVSPPVLLQLRTQLLQGDRYAFFHVIEMTLRQHIRGDLIQRTETNTITRVPSFRFVRTCSNISDSYAITIGGSRRRMTLLSNDLDVRHRGTHHE